MQIAAIYYGVKDVKRVFANQAAQNLDDEKNQMTGTSLSDAELYEDESAAWGREREGSITKYDLRYS